MNRRRICLTDPKHNAFITTVHEVHEWMVDRDGNFIEDLGCMETAQGPHDENCWSCSICHREAAFEDEVDV